MVSPTGFEPVLLP